MSKRRRQAPWVVSLCALALFVSAMSACSADSDSTAAPGTEDGVAVDVDEDTKGPDTAADTSAGQDATAQDSGGGSDASADSDAGLPDGGGGDTSDAGATDAGVDDVSPSDAASSDTGAGDTSFGDTGLGDTGTGDTIGSDAGTPGAPGKQWAKVDPKTCDAGDAAWVRRAMLVISGRLPASGAEVSLWLKVVAQLGRAKAAEAMSHHPNYYHRWAEWISDELRANRIGFRQQPGCFGGETISSASDGLAKHIRDSAPTIAAATQGATMRDVLVSTLRLDDVTPAWRANIFASIVRGQPYCVNAGPMNMEALRRRDFADRFAEVYTGRSAECAPCHNSAFSVNDDPDPTKDHFWPMPGHFEKSVFGSHAMAPEDNWRAMFRRMGVVATPPTVFDYVFIEPKAQLPSGATPLKPWGLHPSCGEFIAENDVAQDPLDQGANFLGYVGKFGTVWQVEKALRVGVDQLRKAKIAIDPNTQLMPAEQGFAWMLSARIAHQVWREVMGRPLTVSHGFPRNKAQRDKLLTLTEAFISSEWSLRKLLAVIVTDPDFNRASPASACGGNNPYALAQVYNPWSVANTDPKLRPNTVGDAVHRLPARVLISATYRALGWPIPNSFGDDANGEFEATIGAYVSDGKAGFSSPTFQGLLAWEHRFGMCKPQGKLVDKKPGAKFSPTSCAGRCGQGAMASFGCVCDMSCNLVGDCCDDIGTVCEVQSGKSGDDFVDKLVKAAESASGATVADVASALKDRLLLDASMTADEGQLVANLFGATSASAPLSGVTDWPERLRMYCGTLLTTPQFMLSGLSAPHTDASAKLSVPGYDLSGVCAELAASTFKPAGYTLTCSPQIQLK